MLTLARALAASAFLSLITGCATRHFTEAILYKCEKVGTGWDNCKQPEDAYSAIHSNNPIFVNEKAKLSVELLSVNPGWIHQDRSGSAAGDGKDARTVTPEQAEHLNGKELWIVTRIIALTSNSPLELEGKTYFKVSNLKFGTQSFRSIPLDMSESHLFTHAMDGTHSYRVRIRVYEVDGFELKRALAKVYQDNPGISGLLVGAWDTVVATIGSLAGDAAVSGAKSLLRVEKLDDPLVIESLLLEGGASVEFEGTFHLYAHANSKSDRDKGWIAEHQFLLYDKWKSEQANATPWNYKYGNREEYLKAQKLTDATIRSADLEPQSSFLRLQIVESEPPKEGLSDTEILAFYKSNGSDERTLTKIRSHQSLPVD